MASRVEDRKLLVEGTAVQGATGAGIGLEVELITDAGGVITGTSILKAGKDYTASTPLLFDHATGTGADLEVGTVDGSGAVTSITITSGGTGYYDIGILYQPSMFLANLVEIDWYDTDRNVPDPMYLTNAFNNIRWYDDATFTTYKEFMALGNIGSISTIEEGFDLSSYSVTLGLSGIPLEMRREAFASTVFTTAFQNRPCKIYTVYLDRNYNIMGEPIMLFSGQMDECTIDVSETISIQITVQSRLINWEIPRGGRYNTNDQQVWFPNDTGFDLIPDLIDKEIDWGGDGGNNLSNVGVGNSYIPGRIRRVNHITEPEYGQDIDE